MEKSLLLKIKATSLLIVLIIIVSLVVINTVFIIIPYASLLLLVFACSLLYCLWKMGREGVQYIRKAVYAVPGLSAVASLAFLGGKFFFGYSWQWVEVAIYCTIGFALFAFMTLIVPRIEALS